MFNLAEWIALVVRRAVWVTLNTLHFTVIAVYAAMSMIQP